MKRGIASLCCFFLFVFVFLTISYLSFAQSYDEGSCCHRDIGALRVKMPKDQFTDWGKFMEISSEQYFFESSVREKIWDKCPIEIDFYCIDALIEQHSLLNKIDSILYKKVDPLTMEARENLWEVDYLIIGTVTPDKITGKTEIWCEEGNEAGSKVCWGGDLIGSFHFKWELVDNHHNKAVVKSLETSWDGEIHDFMGYSNPGYKETYFDKITEMTKSAANLDEIIYDYEQMPLSCKIRLEDDRDYVENGEEIKINLSEIFDYKGRTAKQWQYLIVKVEKGKILNGKVQRGKDAFKIFEVGNGEVEIKYKAPDDCKSEEEKITIYNTCEHRVYNADYNDYFHLKKEISSKKFKIICARGSIEYNHVINFDVMGFKGTGNIKGFVPIKMWKQPKDRKDKPKVNGEGTVDYIFEGKIKDCTFSAKTPYNIKIEGEATIEKEELYFDLKFEEQWPKSFPMTLVCPKQTSTGYMPVVMPVKHEILHFKVQDGFNISQPFIGAGGTGTYSWTLHLGK